MDTPFPQSEEQVAKQDQDLKDFAGEAAPAAPPAPPVPSVPLYNGATAVLIDGNHTGRDMSFKGFGDLKAYPTDNDVQKLRQNQNDPDLLKLFDSMYGAGSSQRYLNYPPLKDVAKLLQNKDDPEFVKLFDRTYGGLSKVISPLYDTRTGDVDRMYYASRLTALLDHGRDWAEKLTDNSLNEALGSASHGVTAGVKELARSGAEGIDAIAGTHLADQIGSSADTRITNHPLLNGIIEGVSQFATGRVVTGGLLGGLGGAGKAAAAVREMSLASFVNAFGFSPDDPLLGDFAKSLGMGDNWFTKLDSIENYKSELAKRGARAGEGAALGAALDLIGAAWKGVKAYRAGDVKGAEDAKAQVADIMDHQMKQQELPLGEPEHQLSLPLGKPDGLPQKNFLDIVKDRIGDNVVDVRHDEKGIEYLTATKGWKRMSWDRFNLDKPQLIDRYGAAHQLELPLGEPVEGPFTHGREPGTQGELFALPEATKADIEAGNAPHPELAQHPEVSPEGTPKSYSREEVLATPREQFIKDQIEKNQPVVREVKQDIEGVRSTPTNVPQSVRDILDRVPDFSKFDLASIRSYIAPVMDDFLKVSKNSPIELERMITSRLTGTEGQKLQALTSTAVARAEQASREAGSKLEAFKKAKVTDAREIASLEAQVKDAHSFLRDLQKLDFPLSAHAGRLLQQRQIEARLTAARRVDIDKLRASGVSEERINQMLRTAMDQVDTTRLSELNHERMLAISQGDHGKVENLDKLIRSEMKSVEKQANRNALRLHNQIVKDIATFTINNILSGTGTAIRNVVGIVGHNPIFRANQLVGGIRENGLAGGLRSAVLQSKARRMALRYGFQSNTALIRSMVADAAKDAFHNVSHVAGQAGLANRITADKYGLKGKPAAVVNALGRGSDLLTWPLRFTDEVSSDVIGRHAVGTRAGFNFAESLQSQKELVQAKLRDPKLTATEREGFQKDMNHLNGKNPTVLIDGKRVTLQEHVEQAVQKAYDGTGRLVDPNAIDEVNYILLRNRQTAPFAGQAIEKLVNTTPYMRFLVPIFNAPMNGFKRGFEMIPGLRNRFVTDLYNELHSDDPYIRSMAAGKFYTGYAILGTALLMADQGLITKGDVQSRGERLSNQSSSSPGPNTLMLMGHPVDISGLDPLSIPLVWAATFTDSLKQYMAAHDQAEKIQNETGTPIPILEHNLNRLMDVGYAIMGATGAAIMQNPALGSLKDVMDLLVTMQKATEDEGAVGREFEKLERGQASKAIPNAWKQMAGLFDNKRYDPGTIVDMLDTVAGSTANAAMRYDMLGRPMVNKEPLRSLLGPLAAIQPPTKDSKGQYVVDTLDNWGQMTGKYFTFDSNPPDAILKRYGVDLRTFDSAAGRKVVDQFAKNYREVTVNGRTVDEALYNIVTDAVQRHAPVGNKLQRGDIYTTLDGTVNEYKNLAWELTLRKELARGNSPLVKQINAAYAMKYAVKNPAFDQPQQQTIQQRTREMLRLFPQQ
jgi:hypothetical protein